MKMTKDYIEYICNYFNKINTIILINIMDYTKKVNYKKLYNKNNYI